VHAVLWIITSLATAITISIANIIDSHILSKKLGLHHYLLIMSAFMVISASIVFVIFPFPEAPGFKYIMAGIGGGLTSGFALVILFNAMQKGEVSRIIPVTSSFPIWVAVLSMPLLGEMLNLWQWMAIVLTVAGAVLISLQRGEGGGQKTRLQKSFILLLFVALLFSLSNIGYSYAMKELTFWNTFTINGICAAVVALAFSARKSHFQELKKLEQRNQKIAWVFGNQTIAALGIILSFIAISSGPVALVSTIMNIRPAFILVFSLIVSRVFPGFITEHVDRRTIIIKVVGIALITGGVVIIGLSG
jgi:drug/metabolite transporter (DMT)-like permease